MGRTSHASTPHTSTFDIQFQHSACGTTQASLMRPGWLISTRPLSLLWASVSIVCDFLSVLTAWLQLKHTAAPLRPLITTVHRRGVTLGKRCIYLLTSSFD